MLTGDNEYTAKAVAQELELDDYQADCLPEDKYEKVKVLQSKGKIVAMAGDGINDAPALEQANVERCSNSGSRACCFNGTVALNLLQNSL